MNSTCIWRFPRNNALHTQAECGCHARLVEQESRTLLIVRSQSWIRQSVSIARLLHTGASRPSGQPEREREKCTETKSSTDKRARSTSRSV